MQEENDGPLDVAAVVRRNVHLITVGEALEGDGAIEKTCFAPFGGRGDGADRQADCADCSVHTENSSSMSLSGFVLALVDMIVLDVKSKYSVGTHSDCSGQ